MDSIFLRIVEVDPVLVFLLKTPNCDFLPTLWQPHGYRCDRFARSLRQLANALEEFRALGIDFVSLHVGVYTSTPNGRLVFGFIASIAQFERELIRDRVRSGIALARIHGKRFGRPRVVVDRMRIATLRKDGRFWAKICDALGASKGTAQRAVLSLPKNLQESALGSS